ncbi:eukaryotic translation initiation factor 3 subunit A [Entomophthora muscae]|uniref:Eukaryotic translation initiation factor 3 subunit A n=1 Tax=Entomophthora muscae TaxID=34485 RepID=A0ACC2SDY7_9FUNG|nr:eukaryotic translation initiation factor 3 subunit A [Entomophthora muscae]
MSRYNLRPESAFKRAEELLGVGQEAPALQILLEMVSRVNRSVSVTTMEPIMLKFIELCVSQKKSKIAKDGLMSYKNFAQNTDPTSIETVVKKYITLVEEKLSEAQAQADKLVEEAVDDLEELETPESLLMWTVSGEESKDRTDRKVVTPYLKMLWEAYRNILDILKNNSRLESIYQTVAAKTFHFCTEHKRKNEFRRLCELLRHHLGNFAKYSHQTHSVNLNDAESLQRQLSIRFGQLNTATELELWHEAFRSVEDIHNLLSTTKNVPKASMMVNYFSKMTKILLVSQNYLFHAAAQNRYYTTLKSSGARVSLEQRQDISSQVLLSVLSVPVITTPKIRAGLVDQDDAKSKSSRLASLLGLTSIPTRAGLLKELLGDNILERVRPEIRNLYNFLEAEFHPLSICKKVAPILSALETRPSEAKYVAPLREVILTRLLQQLSQVYTSIKIDSVVKLASLAPTFEYDAITIEKIIMNGCKRGELSIKIDHHTRAITFETDLYAASNTKIAEGTQLQKTPSELMRTQLTNLGKRLNFAVNMIDPSIQESKKKAKKDAIARALASAEEEHKKAIGRRAIIERRKEIAETLQIRKEKEEAREKAIKLQREQELERQRLAEETKFREEERKRREIESIQLEEAKKLAESIKEKMNIEVELKDLNTDKLMQIQVEHLEKEKNEMQTKLKSIARHIDHLERAYRKEEIPLLERDYQRQLKADKAYHEVTHKTLLEASKAKHEENMAMKARFSRILDASNNYSKEVHSRRSESHRAKMAELQVQLEAEKEARRAEYRKIKEAQDKAEAEARKKAEEEKALLQAKEREEQEKLERRKAEEEAKRVAQEQHQRKLDETARIQQERDRLAEEKIARSRQNDSFKSPSSGKFVPPALRQGEAGKASPASSGKYVLPIRRGEPSRDDRPASQPSSNPWRRAAPPAAAVTPPAAASPEPSRPANVKPGAWRAREAAKSTESKPASNDDGFIPVSRGRRT